MKKLTKICCMALTCMLCGFVLVACGKAKIEKAYIKAGTIETVVAKGDTWSKDNAVAVVQWTDKTKKEIPASELEFSPATVDTSTVGTKEITVTYEDFEFKFTVEVVASEADVSTITSFSSDLINKYNSNSGEKIEKQTEFFVKNKIHLVGDDNPMDWQIAANGRDGAGKLVEGIEKVRTEITVQLVTGTADATTGKISNPTYTNLSGTELAKYVENMDTENSTIDFTESAIGKVFKVRIKAVNYDESKFDEDVNSPDFNPPYFEDEFKVVDGYNVYTAKELSLFDNANQDGYWTTLKKEWGYMDANGNLLVNPNALVLQTNIEITRDVVPANHFYTYDELYNQNGTLKTAYDSDLGTDANGNPVNPVGSLKDGHEAIYTRNVTNTEEKTALVSDSFTLYGNYFSINIENFPKAVYGMDDTAGKYWHVNNTEGQYSYVCMHKPLFRADGVRENGSGVLTNENKDVLSTTGIVTMQDTYFIGNGNRGTDATASGGLMLTKARATNFTADNTIHKDFFIGWMTEYGYNFTGASATGNLLQQYIAMEGNNGKEIAPGMVVPDLNAKYTFLNNKGYNDYNSLFYFWGSPNVYVENNEMIGAGGPAIIIDHASPGAITHVPVTTDNGFNAWVGGSPTYVDIVDSTIESMVNGQEPWFITYGVEGLVQQYLSLETNNTSTRSTVEKDNKGAEYINMIMIYKHGKKELAAGGFSRGYMRMFDTKADYTSYYTNGTLSDGSTYFGYDRTVDWTLSTDLTGDGNADVPGQYTANSGGLKNLGLIAKGDKTQTGHYENSKTGAFGLSTSGDANLYTGGYINVYLSNGFGAMFEVFDRPQA